MIYAICDEKGGCGKSTTAGAILSGATLRGKKALAVDLDPQANLSFSTGGDLQKPGIWEVMTGKEKAADVIQHTDQGDIITAGPMLFAAETQLEKSDRNSALKKTLKSVKGKYDLVVVDCPPTTGSLLLNALTFADRAIIPTGANIFALQGMAFLIQIIREAQANYNSRLKISGILFTMYNDRTNSNRTYREIIEEQAKKWRVPVFKSRIRRGVAIEEAQTARESIFTYAPKSNPAKDYNNFLDELNI